MNEQLKQFAMEAVKQSEQLNTSNEAKKRTAFAYINKKVLENNLEDISFEEIDNAIEAAKECDNKLIKVSFRKEDSRHRILVIIENTYNNKDVDTERIFEKGVSSKSSETNSGLGLWKVRQILKRNNNLNLFTTKSSDMFKQQIEIYY